MNINPIIVGKPVNLLISLYWLNVDKNGKEMPKKIGKRTIAQQNLRVSKSMHNEIMQFKLDNLKELLLLLYS